MSARSNSLAGLLVAGLLTLSTAGVSADPVARNNTDPTPPRPAAGEILMIGSSSVNGAFGRLIEKAFEDRGVSLLRHGRSATGLARPDFFDWPQHIERAGAMPGVRGAVILLGGNDTQSMWLRASERRPGSGRRSEWIEWNDAQSWQTLYRERMRVLVDALCDAGVPKVLVIAPADGTMEGWMTRVRRVQDAQLEGAQRSRCGVGIDTRGPTRPKPSDTVDGIHLSRSGSTTVWARIGETVLQHFGLTP